MVRWNRVQTSPVSVMFHHLYKQQLHFSSRGHSVLGFLFHEVCISKTIALSVSYIRIYVKAALVIAMD